MVFALACVSAQAYGYAYAFRLQGVVKYFFLALMLISLLPASEFSHLVLPPVSKSLLLIFLLLLLLFFLPIPRFADYLRSHFSLLTPIVLRITFHSYPSPPPPPARSPLCSQRAAPYGVPQDVRGRNQEGSRSTAARTEITMISIMYPRQTDQIRSNQIRSDLVTLRIASTIFTGLCTICTIYCRSGR